MPPARNPGVARLWSGTVPRRPVPLLIDAPESLMRARPVPVEGTAGTPDGDVIQHFRAGRQLYLEVAESGTSAADRIVYATGGCRLLVFIKDGAAGSLRLVLRQHRHTLLTFEPASRDFALLDVPLPARAPWEM